MPIIQEIIPRRVSKRKKQNHNYEITVYKYGHKTPAGYNGYDYYGAIWAENIDDVRRNLILNTPEKGASIEVAKGNTFIGTLDIQGSRYKWQPKGRNIWYKVDPRTGKLRGD